MENNITEEKALVELKKGYSNARETLNNEDKMEELLQRLEKKLKTIPKVGDKLSHIPVFVSLIKNYIKKEYTAVPIGSIVAIISALLYFVSPVDLILDVMPVIGYVDDAAVIAACLTLVESDIEEYLQWRDANGKTL